MIYHTFKMCTGDAGPEQSLVLFNKVLGEKILSTKNWIIAYFHDEIYMGSMYLIGFDMSSFLWIRFTG